MGAEVASVARLRADLSIVVDNDAIWCVVSLIFPSYSLRWGAVLTAAMVGGVTTTKPVDLSFDWDWILFDLALWYHTVPYGTIREYHTILWFRYFFRSRSRHWRCHRVKIMARLDMFNIIIDSAVRYKKLILISQSCVT